MSRNRTTSDAEIIYEAGFTAKQKKKWRNLVIQRATDRPIIYNVMGIELDLCYSAHMLEKIRTKAVISVQVVTVDNPNSSSG